MALPTVRGVSAASANGTTTVAPGIPSGTASGELMLAVLGGGNTGTWSVSNQNGGNWAVVGQAEIGATTTAANVTIFYDYYNGTQGTPTFNTPGNNGVGRIMTITGARSADGATFAGLSADLSDSDGNASCSLASGFSTTDADCLIVLAAAAADDSPTFGASWTNGNLASITIQVSDTTTQGNDSSVELVTGTLATAGAVGTFANTLTAAVNVAGLVLAIRPPAGSSTVTGVALTTTPSLPAGKLNTSVTGVALTTTPSLPAGALDTSPRISFVGSATGSAQNGTNMTLDLTGITGLAQNDLVLVVAGTVTSADTGEIATSSSGWTVVGSAHSSDTRGHINFTVFRKFMGASPDTSIVITAPVGQLSHALSGTAMAFRTVNQSTPFDVAHTTATATNTNTVNASSIDWSTAGTAVVVAAGGTDITDTSEAVTMPAGYTTNAAYQFVSETFIVWTGMGYNLSPSDPEDPGNVSVVNSDTSDAAASMTMALRVAAAPTQITGVALTTTPSLPAGSLNTSVTGVALTTTPSLPAGSLRTSVTGVALTTTPSLPAGTLNTSVTGVALTTTPSLPAGETRQGVNILGVALTTTPSLPAGSLSTSVTGVALTTTPSLPAGSLSTSVTGVALTTTPSLPAGSLHTAVTGVTLTTTPSLPAGTITSGESIVGVALTTSPSLPAGALSTFITGVALTTSPSLPAGLVQPGVGGVVLTTTPSLPAGQLSTRITGVVLTTTPSLPAGSLSTSITGVVLTTTPTLPAGSLTVSQIVTGVSLSLELVIAYPQGEVLGGEGEPLQAPSNFPVGTTVIRRPKFNRAPPIVGR